MHEINTLHVFTDGSVNPQLNIGYGAFLAVTESEITVGNAEKYLKIKRFEDTSSTKLELECLIWALTEIGKFEGKIVVYTDSQNITGLMNRHERLEKNDFQSKKGRTMNHAELYRQFFRMIDLLNCEFRKVEGHKKTNQKDNIDRLFTLVDRASRNAVRVENGKK